MDLTRAKRALEWVKRHPSALTLFVLFCWFAFFVALLAGSKDDSVLAPRPGGFEGPNHQPGDSTPDGFVDAGGETDPLDQVPPTFNFAELTMASLTSTLSAVFNLQLSTPGEADGLEIIALEKGGRPLGQILAELFAPHGYALYGQENTVTMIPAQYPPQGTSIGAITTTFQYDWDKPLTVWLGARPALKIAIATQPLSGKSDKEPIGFSIRATSGLNTVLNTTLEVRMGERAEVLSAGQRTLRITLEPQSVDASQMTLKLSATVSGGN